MNYMQPSVFLSEIKHIKLVVLNINCASKVAFLKSSHICNLQYHKRLLFSVQFSFKEENIYPNNPWNTVHQVVVANTYAKN